MQGEKAFIYNQSEHNYLSTCTRYQYEQNEFKKVSLGPTLDYDSNITKLYIKGKSKLDQEIQYARKIPGN